MFYTTVFQAEARVPLLVRGLKMKIQIPTGIKKFQKNKQYTSDLFFCGATAQFGPMPRNFSGLLIMHVRTQTHARAVGLL
jgi:hypothetical protein